MKLFRNFILELIIAIGIIGTIGIINNFGNEYYLAGDVTGPQSVDLTLDEVIVPTLTYWNENKSEILQVD